jgi:hypothetical protein
MEFWSTIGGLIRRKGVIIPAVLVAVALGALAYSGTPTVYESSTTMVMTTTQYGGSESRDPTKPTELTNPMLNFNDSLRTTSTILIQAMNTPDVFKQLGVTRGTTQLIINDGRTNPDLLGSNGPFLYIEGSSTSPEDARRVVVNAQELMEQKLIEWQKGLNAPEKTYVSLVDVVSPTPAQATGGRATKLALMAFLFGFVLCLGIAYFGHQIRARRSARAAVVSNVVDTTPPPHEGPAKGRSRRSSRSPMVDAVGVEEDRSHADIEDVQASQDQAAEPAVVAPMKKKAESDSVPTPLKQAGPSVTPTRLKKKAELAVVRAPVKPKVRSRSR